jgi:2'-5' RNA ligase
MMETTRCFLAVPVSKENIDKIVTLQNELSAANADVKFVEAENFHYNLKFFGYKTESEIKQIMSAIENAIKGKKPFELNIAGIGTFPTPNSVRVVWLGMIKGKKELIDLANELESAFTKIGIEPENRPFEPHLTLCRVHSTYNIENLKKIIKSKQNINIGKMVVDELVLYKSILSRNGPTYVELKKFRL